MKLKSIEKVFFFPLHHLQKKFLFGLGICLKENFLIFSVFQNMAKEVKQPLSELDEIHLKSNLIADEVSFINYLYIPKCK